MNHYLKYTNMFFILGDMLELGKKEIQYHQQIVDLLEKNKIKKCILVGEIFQNVDCKYDYYKVDNIDIVCKSIEKYSIHGYTVLIKGSRKLKLEKITSFL